MSGSIPTMALEGSVRTAGVLTQPPGRAPTSSHTLQSSGPPLDKHPLPGSGSSRAQIPRDEHHDLISPWTSSPELPCKLPTMASTTAPRDEAQR